MTPRWGMVALWATVLTLWVIQWSRARSQQAPVAKVIHYVAISTATIGMILTVVPVGSLHTYGAIAVMTGLVIAATSPTTFGSPSRTTALALALVALVAALAGIHVGANDTGLFLATFATIAIVVAVYAKMPRLRSDL